MREVRKGPRTSFNAKAGVGGSIEFGFSAVSSLDRWFETYGTFMESTRWLGEEQCST